MLFDGSVTRTGWLSDAGSAAPTEFGIRHGASAKCAEKVLLTQEQDGMLGLISTLPDQMKDNELTGVAAREWKRLLPAKRAPAAQVAGLF